MADGAMMYGRGEVFPLVPGDPVRSWNKWGVSTKITVAKVEHMYSLIKARIAREDAVKLLTRLSLSQHVPRLLHPLASLVVGYLYPNEFGIFWITLGSPPALGYR